MPSDALAPYCGNKTAFQSTYPLDLCLTNAGLFGDDITGMDRFPLWNGIDQGSIFQPQFYHGYYGQPQLVDGGVAAAIAPSLPISSSSGMDDCIGPGSSSCPNLFGYVHQGLEKEASVLLGFRPSAPSVFEFDAAGTLSETSCSRPLKRARKQRKAGRSKTKKNGGIETDDLPGGSNSNFSSTVPGQLEGGKMSLIIKSEPTGTGLPREENDDISAGSRSSATWTREEDGRLASAVARHGTESWVPASTFVSGRTPVECASRWYGSLNLSFRRGRWTSQEDQLLKNAVAEWVRCVVGFGSVYDDGETTTDEWLTRVDACGGYKAVPWKEIAKITTHRNAVQCQTRWTETLDPNVKKSAWTPEEDETLIRGVETWSHSWNKIAAAIPGRTQRQCRSRYIQISTQRELAESESLIPPSNDLSQKPPDPNFVPEFLQGNSTTDESFWTRYEDFVTTECFESEAVPFRSGQPLAEYPGC